jgi:hypothetical protein
MLAACLLFGCASEQKAARKNASKVDWSQQVGVYYYKQALAELGPPAVLTESPSGTTAEWVLRRSPRVSFGLGTAFAGPHTAVGVGNGVPLPQHGENLRLRFGPDGRLEEWSKINF